MHRVQCLRFVAACAAIVSCSSSESAGVDASADASLDGSVEAAGDASPSDADGGACTLVRPYSSKNATCNSCAQAKCCVEINACLVDPDCDMGYVDCALACAIDFDAGPDAAADAGPTACLADCARQFPKGRMEYDKAIGCADRACATECQ